MTKPCAYCGDPVESDSYERNYEVSCGKSDCERYQREREEAEREDAHRDLDERMGWNR